MKRRYILGLIGLGPFALISSKVPTANNPLINILIKRWKQSKEYTLAVLNAMPIDKLEYQPSKEQMSFAQHFMHIGFTNNAFIGILMDSATYPDFNALTKATFFLERPDSINLFQPDFFKSEDSYANKKMVTEYLIETFDYVISSLSKLNDDTLEKGLSKEKPWFLKGHTNLDLILRGESHTSHHRSQAISYLRMNDIKPPGYSKNNTL